MGMLKKTYHLWKQYTVLHKSSPREMMQQQKTKQKPNKQKNQQDRC